MTFSRTLTRWSTAGRAGRQGFGGLAFPADGGTDGLGRSLSVDSSGATGKRRKIRLRAPRPPPWAGGEIAANLECLLYYIAVFLLSTHIADPSCARLMWPGHGGLFHPSQPAHASDGRGLLHHHDLRERVPLVVTQALAAEPKGQPRARCCCCLFSWSSVFLYLGSSSPFCDCGCGPSRPARLR